MKYKSIFILAVVFLAAGVHAQTTPPQSALLYKITGKTLKKPSYLFGTIHILCEKDLTYAEKLGTYVSETEQIMLEVDLDDPEVLKKVAESALLKDGKTLRDMLTPEEFAKLDTLYKSYLGISFELLQNMTPIMASTYLYTSPKIVGCVQPAMLDQALAYVAKERKIALIGLESAEQQLALLNSEPLVTQIKWLKELSSNPDKSIGQFQSMYKVYLSQDSDALYEIMSREMKVHGSSQDVLLDKRNQNWIPLIEAHIARTPTFIGVGAGHLGGKTGVVALLRAKGYKLTPIRL